uniref:Anoctamin n=1 Tax=Leptobrachium leishanense TaxID=445787 RepID=A0A8C5QW77_9ANUR
MCQCEASESPERHVLSKSAGRSRLPGWEGSAFRVSQSCTAIKLSNVRITQSMGDNCGRSQEVFSLHLYKGIMGSWKGTICECCQTDSIQTLAVIQLKPDVNPETKKWLTAFLKALSTSGGPGILVHPGEDDEGHILLLSATECLLLQATENLGFAKMDCQGIMRTFSCSSRQDFLNSDKIHLFLTLSEQQFLLKHEVENLKVHEETSIPGYPQYVLFPGQHIVYLLQKLKIIVKFYPLHDKPQLDTLTTSWYRQVRFTPQPIDAIRGYFGEPVAFYFDFLGYFTLSLMAMMLLSHFCALFQDSLDKYVIFAVFNILWSTVIMEFWKRHSSVKAYFWGTLQRKSYLKSSRVQFWGTLTKSPITGRWGLYYPQWKRTLRILFVTMPSVCLFLGLTLDGMLMFLYWEKWTRDQYHNSSNLREAILFYLPSVLHTLYMEALNALYARAAAALTEWENHRLETSFQNHLTVKVLLFRFINCFGLLFYITFYLQDLQLLHKRLSSLLIVSQMINQFSEFLLPYLRQKLKVDAWSVAGTHPFIDEVVSQGDLPRYPGLFEEYMELFVQFGYVSLFSCVYPFTAALLILNNITEIRTDAIKVSQFYQKPFPEAADGIGVWQVAFEILGYISIITNCFLISVSPEVQAICKEYEVGPESFLLYMLGTEHLLIIIKLVVAFAIPDIPAWLQLKMAQLEYHALDTESQLEKLLFNQE